MRCSRKVGPDLDKAAKDICRSLRSAIGKLCSDGAQLAAILVKLEARIFPNLRLHSGKIGAVLCGSILRTRSSIG